MGGGDDSSSARQESNHLAIATIMGLSIVRFADQKQRPRHAWSLPPGPRTTSVAETHFSSEASHQRTVESESPFKVANAHEDVREQFEFRSMGLRRLT
jgi:hypothetical protein